VRKIYFAVFGSGLGHATRVLDIAERLAADGDTIRFSCSGQGLSYIRTHGPQTDSVECPSFDVEWTEEGSFSSKAFMYHFPLMLRSFSRQVSFEANSIAKFAPMVTVSDSRLSAVLAAKARSCPVVTMLNQFKVTLPPRYRGDALGRLYERIAGDVLGLMWSLSEEVLLTDLPPPYTIGEANVAGTDLSRIVRYVGFTSPGLEVSEERLQKAREVLGFDKRPLVFFQISGPDATKKRFIDIVLGSVSALSGRYKVVVSMGYLGGSGEPRRLADGTLLYDWCPIKDELFTLSDVLVARSGHRTIGQCIDAGKPAVLIPIHNHSEQIGNAEKFQSLGLGIAISPGDFDAERLTEAVDSCIHDPKFRKNLEAVRLISKKYRGVERCAEIIDSYA
jgi:UDP-N-acetylglucosamine--N-acetylmuramyl-(pentapeptide) pyrophosphoryl-undecaprenol N-acetylglucosamine transferase